MLGGGGTSSELSRGDGNGTIAKSVAHEYQNLGFRRNNLKYITFIFRYLYFLSVCDNNVCVIGSVIGWW